MTDVKAGQRRFRVEVATMVNFKRTLTREKAMELEVKRTKKAGDDVVKEMETSVMTRHDEMGAGGGLDFENMGQDILASSAGKAGGTFGGFAQTLGNIRKLDDKVGDDMSEEDEEDEEKEAEDPKQPKVKEVNADKESLAALREGEKFVGKCCVCCCFVAVVFILYVISVLFILFPLNRTNKTKQKQM